MAVDLRGEGAHQNHFASDLSWSGEMRASRSRLI